MLQKLRIATRESQLALWQANHVRSLLLAAHPGLEVEIIGMTTEGDRNKVTPLSRLGGKGVFVKELESALLESSADIAVHSMKDVPSVLPPGLGIHCICEREDPRDAFVSNRFESLSALPQGARVGTSSLRRRLQIKALYPHLLYPELRGNVDTRLGKLDSEEYEGIILATAGLKRLGLGNRITQHIDPSQCIPSAGQGAVGIECSNDRADVIALLAAIGHHETTLRVESERVVSRGLGANCTLPIAAHAEISGDSFKLSAFVSDEAGSRTIRASQSSPIESCSALGSEVVAELMKQGARDLLGQNS